MEALITILPGDGIGPEVCTSGVEILEKIARKYNHKFNFSYQMIGGAAIDDSGNPFPQETADSCSDSHAVLLGAVGGPKWNDPNLKVRPEQGLLSLRASLKVFANLRPVQIFPQLIDASPIKNDRLEDVDIMVVRELTGGIYFGKKERTPDMASDLCIYEVDEIKRVIRIAANIASNRTGKICSVDKANVLETSRLWRDITTNLLNNEFPNLNTEHLLVDAAAMHLINRPKDFDVIVTENMFGDILTDEASMLTGSLGMLPSASIGATSQGLYEPIHGSAPDIAGKGLANPCGMVLSCALLLRHSLSLEEEAKDIENSVKQALENGARTTDIASANDTPLSTIEMTSEIIKFIQ